MRKIYDFDYFLILSSCTTEKSSGKASKAKKSKTAYDSSAKFYHNFEDEFLEQEAALHFSFDTPKSDRDRPDQTHKTTVAMLIERPRHKAALASISAMINM